MKVVPAAAIALLSASMLTGCIGGAQNQDPSADDPGQSDDRTNPAQANKNACELASDAVLATLSDNSSAGPARAAWVFQGDGGWYMAAPLGQNGTLSDTVGLWASNADPTDPDFSGDLYALNGDARNATSLSSAAPASFRSESKGGKQALECATETDD